MASGEVRTSTVTTPGGDAGPVPDAERGHGLGLHGAPGADSSDPAVVDRSATVGDRTPGPFTPRQLSRLDEALTLSSRETQIAFSVWVGALEEPTRAHAERLHSGLPRPAEGVLIAVSPGQRVLHIVTGEVSSKRLPDRACALAALSMRASLSVGDLLGALVNGLRMLSDQAGRPHERPGAPH